MATTGSTTSSKSRGSVTVTRGIRVSITPTFVPEQSGRSEAWEGPRYVFSYLVRITNEGTVRVKLLSRHWTIVDADGERHEVRGPGVVGQQPDLVPGQVFEYPSYCPLATPWGTMEGEYQMEDEFGNRFEALISRFYLVAPE